MTFRKTTKHLAARGFTLIEMMAVVLIIGLILGVVGLNIFRQAEKAEIKAAESQISALGNAITAFRLDCGFFPESLQNLVGTPPSSRTCRNFSKSGYLQKKEIPLDPWKNPYNFTSPGLHNTEEYDLWSSGPDGQEGTSDDITSWASTDTGTDQTQP